jgi:hypothetical protein
VVHIGATKPSPPQNLTLTVNDLGMVLDWDPPAQDGGAPVTQYAVILDDHFLVGHPYVRKRTITTSVTESAVFTD